MKNYDFDRIIDRSGSNDIKHTALKKLYGHDDLLPLWVADMDFATPDFIVDAMRKRLEHPIFGYTSLPEDYYPAIVDWIRLHHQWEVSPEWLMYIPGIVKGIGFVVNGLLASDDKIVIQTPVYHPFRLVPQANGREVVFNTLKRRDDGGYEMDFENLEQVCDEKCKLLILSNPHNPAGICWSRETLLRLAKFCYDRGMTVISDEIHCDLALFGHRHVPFASVSEQAARISITFQAPTKTFNMAGIVSSYAIIVDDNLRERFFGWMRGNEFDAPNIFAPIATIAAYRQGENWRRQLIDYLEGNIVLVENFCKEHLPQIRPLRPEASFLVWLDCRSLRLSHDQLMHLFVDGARLALNDGAIFGEEGEGFMRLNIASPHSIILEALQRLEGAVRKLTGTLK